MFLGFLESGKTKFIQETFEDPRMESGEKTLLLICEEGEEEYDPHLFKVKRVDIEYIESEADLTQENLSALALKHRCDRVIVEYNGTWLLQSFFDAMPEDWVINQMMTFFDSATFLNYNRNMRQLVYDKIQLTQMVVFNRFKGEYDKMAFHKVVRAISRRADIVYEYIGGKAEFDDIEDPLPFDIDAPVIEVEDRDFALWYRDISEEPKKYDGKTVRFKGMVALDKRFPKGMIAIGRFVMTCCEADTQYMSLLCQLPKDNKIKHKDWLQVTATIAVKNHPLYQGVGPVLTATEFGPSEAPEQEVATFY